MSKRCQPTKKYMKVVCQLGKIYAKLYFWFGSSNNIMPNLFPHGGISLQKKPKAWTVPNMQGGTAVGFKAGQNWWI